jgi:tetratricopeptide (TPR) repeat protein
MYNTNVVLQGNTVQYCSLDGLLFENYSSGNCQTSIIANAYRGIECKQYSNPQIFCNNTIKANKYGAYGDGNSVPTMGQTSTQGYNSFISNTTNDVWSGYSSTIYARYNWWGSYPPNPKVTSNVDYANALNYDPNGSSYLLDSHEMPQQGEAGSTALSKTTIDTLGMAALQATYLVFLQEEYQTALILFETIVADYPSYFAGRSALAFVVQCLLKLERESEALGRMAAVAAAYPELEIAGLAKSIAVGYLIKGGQFAEAISRAQAVLQGFPGTTLAKYALFDLATINWYFLADHTTGEIYYRQFIAQYPEDDLTISVLATLGEWQPGSLLKPELRPSEAQTLENPNSVALFANYPNPFNPTTLIRYQLPVAIHVALRIYNFLGQAVRTLVEEDKSAGCHDVVWNGKDDQGQDLPSGVYVYQLSATSVIGQSYSFTQSKKLLLLR